MNNKHTRRRKNFFLSIGCVFLCTSCGVPSWIYLDDSISSDNSNNYYHFTNTRQTTLTADATSTKLSYYIDESSIDNNDYTPSVAYFYAVVPESIYSGCESSFISQFSTKYVNDNNGSNFTASSNDSILTISKTANSNTEDIGLYCFSVGTDQDLLTPPQYSITRNVDLHNDDGSANEIITNLLLDAEGSDDGIFFTLQQTNDSNGDNDDSEANFIHIKDDGTEEALQDTSIPLYRTNNDQYFNLSEDMNDVDFQAAYTLNNESTSSDNYKVIVFAAFNLTPLNDASFTNIFWSSLETICYFKLTV